jgi:uncharacterized protein with GYD domain
MPAYITLVNFTDQGVRNVKDTTKRADHRRQGRDQAQGDLLDHGAV